MLYDIWFSAQWQRLASYKGESIFGSTSHPQLENGDIFCVRNFNPVCQNPSDLCHICFGQVKTATKLFSRFEFFPGLDSKQELLEYAKHVNSEVKDLSSNFYSSSMPLRLAESEIKLHQGLRKFSHFTPLTSTSTQTKSFPQDNRSQSPLYLRIVT